MLLKRIAFVVLLAFFVGYGIALVWAHCHNDQDHDGADCEEPFQHLITGKKWKWLENHTVEYYINPDKPHPGLPHISTDIRAAAETWSGIEINAQYVAFYLDDVGFASILPEADDGESIVGWYDLDADNPDFTANADITVQANTNRIIEADIQLNYYSPFTTHANANNTTYCLRNTLTHEFGHWLGLGDVRPQHECAEYQHYTMWQTPVKVNCDKESLSCEDIWGAKHLYGLTGG